MSPPVHSADSTRAESNLQIFDALDAATEAALRASISKHGVLVPIAVDQNGRVLDGHHRSRIATELDVPFDTVTHWVTGDEHAREIARTLNEDRRQLPIEQRREVVADLREQGHSVRSIAGAIGVPKSTVADDVKVSESGQVDSEIHEGQVLPIGNTENSQPERVKGTDGKSYPAKKPKPQLSEEQQAEQDRLELCERTTYAYAHAVSQVWGLVRDDPSFVREHWLPAMNPLAGLPLEHLVTAEGTRELARFLNDVANDISQNTGEATLRWA